jgi:hypothetical protein
MEKNKTPDKWLIKKVNGADTLTDQTGTPIECIYKAPVMLPHPTIAGQVVIKVALCCEKCPNFDLQAVSHGILTLHCTGRKIEVYNDGKQESQLKML